MPRRPPVSLPALHRTCLAAAAFLLVSVGARAQEMPERGEYETLAIGMAVAELGASVAREPWDRPVCEVHVRALPIFLEDDVLPTWLNVFHRVTRERVIRAANTLEPGDVFTEQAFADAERALRDSSVFSVSAVVPIAPLRPEVADATPGCIDVLIVTRDVWSLRANGSIETNGSTVTSLYLGGSESNLFGSGDTLAVGFSRTLGSWRMGPTYWSQHFAGSRLVVYEDFDFVIDREVGGLEGTSNVFQIGRPLYDSEVPWAWAFSMEHDSSLRRRYTGTRLDTYRIDGFDVPERYRARSLAAGATVTRSWGTTMKREVEPGFRVAWTDYSPVPRTALPDEVLAQYRRDRLPRSERASGPTLSLRHYRNEHFRLVNYESYGVAEELREGHFLELRLRTSEPGLGADERFFSVGTTVSWRLRLGEDGFAAAGFEHWVRVDDHVSDITLNGSLRLVSSRQFAGRFVARAIVTELRRNGANSELTLGGDTALRGYPIGFLKGTRAVQANVEWRSAPLRIGHARLGGVTSFDVGAAWRGNDLPIYYPSVGVGLRLVIPVTGTIVRAADLSFPLRPAARPVFSVGVAQTF